MRLSAAAFLRARKQLLIAGRTSTLASFCDACCVNPQVLQLLLKVRHGFLFSTPFVSRTEERNASSDHRARRHQCGALIE
jgi:hypothetical protein